MTKKDPFRFKEGQKTASNKEFGLVFAGFFLLISILPLFHKEPIRVWPIPVSVIFLLVSFIKADILAPINSLWTKLGLLLHKIVSPLVLGLLYYIVFLATSVVLKFFKKDLLLVKSDEKSASYWLQRSTDEQTLNMSNQF